MPFHYIALTKPLVFRYITFQLSCFADLKDAIVSVIKIELKIEEKKQNKSKIEITPLAHFDSQGMFARKRVKGRNFSYEFGRLSKEVQEKLDAAIANVLAEDK